MVEEGTSGAVEILTDLNTKIKDLDEKNSLLNEKTLLLGQSFLKQEDRIIKDLSMLKDELKDLRNEFDRLKEGVNHIIHESANFARKEELKIVEKYMKIWEPLKFVKEEEVKRMISEAMKDKK